MRRDPVSGAIFSIPCDDPFDESIDDIHHAVPVPLHAQLLLHYFYSRGNLHVVPGITNRNVSWLIDDITKDPVYGQAEFKAQLVLVWKQGTDKEEARRKIHEFLKQFPAYQVDTEKELGVYANRVARAGAPAWDPAIKKVVWQGQPVADGNVMPFTDQ